MFSDINPDHETHVLFLLFWRKVNLPLRSVEPFVATKAFHTGQQHLFFSPVSCIVSCFSWTPWRKTIDTVINNCAEIVFVSWFWASLQQASKMVEQTPKMFMQPKWKATKKWKKQPIWCLIAGRFTLFCHNSFFARPKWSVRNHIVQVGKEWLLTCPRNKKRVFVKTHAESFHGQGWCQTTSIDKNTVQWQWHGFFCSPLMFCSKTTKNTCSVMWVTALDEVTFH